MNVVQDFESRLTEQELELVSGLDSPAKIQAFLDQVSYSEDPIYRCPLSVIRDNKAHCFDGALFAAAALRRLGCPPLIVEMLPNERDDDHLLAVFKRHGYWGAVAQSNFVGLRFREPVYRSLRELVMSYFEQYFNAAGEKTLRGYRLPMNLKAFDDLRWMVSDEHLETVANGLDRMRVVSVIPPETIADLSLVDERSLKAGLMGANEQGLFKVA